MNEGNYCGDDGDGHVGDVGNEHVVNLLRHLLETKQTDETDTTGETDTQKEETKENPSLEEGDLFTEEGDTWTLYGYRARTQTVDKTISETIKKMQTEPKTEQKLIDEEEKENLRLLKRKEIDVSIKREEVIYVFGMTICFVFCEKLYNIYIYMHTHTHTLCSTYIETLA
jgi:hypothetical protein